MPLCPCVQVRNYFQTQIQKIALAAGDSPVFWEEVSDFAS